MMAALTRSWALCLVAAATWTLTRAADKTTDNVSSRLMVHIPHSLFKEEGYDHREALFGVPPYGGSIAQNVYYADADLCDPIVDTSKGFPTRDIGENGKMLPWPSPYILMVNRGGCTFVQKVRNAQRSGAAGVLIADNTCLCSDTNCVSENPGSCETTEPIMADDGSGADISIPSFLMFKRDADKVKAELKVNRPVQIEMAWSLPNPDDRVEYDLWTVPTDKVSREFLQNFKKIALALGDRAYFTPHMYIYDGIRSHCQGSNGESFCYNLCTNNGRYCATDPDNDLERGISGADVVRESLRRLCIWNYYGSSDGIGAKWWDYLAEFNDRCSDPDYFADDECVNDAYKHAKIEGDKIKRCMEDSGGLDTDVSNSKLDKEITSQTQRGVVVIPTAFVNTAAIRGGLTTTTVFTAICAGFAEGSAPAICSKCGKCSNVAGCVDAGYCPASSGGSAISGDGVSTHTFALSMLFVVALFAGLGVWHYKKTREEMRDQVRGILAEYMPLEDQDKDGMGNGVMGNAMAFARGGGNTSLIS